MALHSMLRANMSVNMVAMVTSGSNDTESLDFNAYERSNVVVASYWGTFVSSAFGGPIVERWGPRRVLTITTIMVSILTGLCVPAAKYNYIALLVARVAMGLFSGFVFPSLHLLISRWAVPSEKGKFVGAIGLGTMGIAFSWAFSGYIIKRFGWEWAFYAFSIIGLVYTTIWMYVVYDNPDSHPRISLDEKIFINTLMERNVQPKKKDLKPYGRILTSIPVLSLMILNFGAGWGAFFIITAAPNYIGKALGLNIASTGFLSGIVYLSKAICGMIYSIIGDMLVNHKLVTITVLRRVSTIVSHILPGLGLLLLLKTGEEPAYYVWVIIISMSLFGAMSVNVYANGHDLTMNFVGTVNGVANSMITVAGFVSPPITAYFTQEEERNPEVWKPVFFIGSAVLILTGVQFMILLSTKIQKWDGVTNATEKVRT